MSLNGYDESSAQGNINNAIVPGDFDIIKATEGVGWTDPDCDANYQQAKAAGKLLGVYHFARPDGNDPVSEAHYFVSQIQGYLGEAIIALDWERYPGLADLTGNVSWAKQWLDTVYQLTQVRPWIYMNQSTANTHDWSSVWADYALWGAQYPTTTPQGYGAPANSITVNGNWTIVGWQYTDNGRLPGWSDPLDLDIAYLDATGWKKYAEGDRNTPAPAVTPAPVVEPTVIVPAPTLAETTTVEPTATVTTPEPVSVPVEVPQPVVEPIVVPATKPDAPSKLSSVVAFVRDVAGLTAVRSYLRSILTPTTGVGRTVRTGLQTSIGLVGFIMLVVSLPSFKDFWLSIPLLTGWAAPASVVTAVTAIWNGIDAVWNYYTNLTE